MKSLSQDSKSLAVPRSPQLVIDTCGSHCPVLLVLLDSAKLKFFDLLYGLGVSSLAVFSMLHSNAGNPQAELMMRVISKWASENDLKLM